MRADTPQYLEAIWANPDVGKIHFVFFSFSRFWAMKMFILSYLHKTHLSLREICGLATICPMIDDDTVGYELVAYTSDFRPLWHCNQDHGLIGLDR